MFERFTERARQVVVLAQDEARGLDHGFVSTGHLLLGLLRECEGIGSRVLADEIQPYPSNKDVLSFVRESVLYHLPTDDVPAANDQSQLPFTRSASAALEKALREALSMGHNYVGTEHILLGVTRLTDTVAWGFLDTEVNVDELRAAITARLRPSLTDRLHDNKHCRSCTCTD